NDRPSRAVFYSSHREDPRSAATIGKRCASPHRVFFDSRKIRVLRLSEIVLELFEAAVPAVSVLVAFLGVREHPMREGDFGRSAQVVKLNRDGRFLSGRIGGPAPGEYKFLGWLDLLVGAAELVYAAVFVAHLELVFAAHLQIEFRDDGGV